MREHQMKKKKKRGGGRRRGLREREMGLPFEHRKTPKLRLKRRRMGVYSLCCSYFCATATGFFCFCFEVSFSMKKNGRKKEGNV